MAKPDWGFFAPQKILAAATALLFAYVNSRGASETGRIGVAPGAHAFPGDRVEEDPQRK